MDEVTHGYATEDKYLWICGVCYHLDERHRPDGMEQRCWCRSGKEEHRWPGYDFNERAVLCRCCGVHVVRSGSRWSAYFCRECQLLGMGASLWEERLVFPIGRHSLMHTWLPRGTPSLRSARAAGGDVETLITPFAEVARGATRAWEWYSRVMSHNLQRLGLRGDVLLREYIDAVDREQLDTLSYRTQTFGSMCSLFKS